MLSFVALLIFIWSQRTGLFDRSSKGAEVIFAPGEIGRIEEPAAARAAQARLQDAELAAVLTHIRSQWGNGAAPVGADTVVPVRKEIAVRTAPFKGDAKLAPLK